MSYEKDMDMLIKGAKKTRKKKCQECGRELKSKEEIPAKNITL